MAYGRIKYSVIHCNSGKHLLVDVISQESNLRFFATKLSRKQSLSPTDKSKLAELKEKLAKDKELYQDHINHCDECKPA